MIMPESVISQGAVFFAIPAAREPPKPTVPDYSIGTPTKTFKPPLTISSNVNYPIIPDDSINVKEILSIINILAEGRDIRQYEQ